jgi:hypothetical protein
MKENIMECFEQLIHDYNKHTGECLKIKTESISDGLGVSLSFSFTNVGSIWFNDCVNLINLANNEGVPFGYYYGSGIDLHFEFTYYREGHVDCEDNIWALYRFIKEDNDYDCLYYDYLSSYWKFEMCTYWECESNVHGLTTIKRENDKLFLIIDYGEHDGVEDKTSWVYPIKTDYNQSILEAVV